MLKPSSIFILLFITLGPTKTITPFVQLTAPLEPDESRRAALRATLAATAIGIMLFLLGRVVLETWGVTFSAVALTGGVILFLLSLQVMLRPPEQVPPEIGDAETMPRSMLISRLVIPTIITPPGIVSILALSVLSEGNARLLLQILILFLAIMLLNLLTMLRARALMGFLTTAGLRMIGWLFAVFQASFGAQIIINSLRRLGALPV